MDRLDGLFKKVKENLKEDVNFEVLTSLIPYISVTKAIYFNFHKYNLRF